MKKIVLVCLFAIELLLAKSENVEVVSKHFEADEIKLVSKFSGDVKVTKGNDVITSDNLLIKFNKNKKPILYTAIGHAKFKLYLKGKHYSGKADKIIYDPVKNLYNFFGNAFLYDEDTDKKVYGDEIKIDKLNGKYDVKSAGNKPVKFIFKVEEK